MHLECHIFKKSNALVEMFSTIFFHFYKYYLLVLHSHFRNKRFMLKRNNLAKYFKIRHTLGIWKPHFMWLIFFLLNKNVKGCHLGEKLMFFHISKCCKLWSISTRFSEECILVDYILFISEKYFLKYILLL